MVLTNVFYYYKDRKGRSWKVWKEKLPKKKGEWLQWWGLRIEDDWEFRADTKSAVLKEIKRQESTNPPVA